MPLSDNDHRFAPGEQFKAIQPTIDPALIQDLISAQLMLTQSMTDLAESIRALAEAMGEPDMGDNPDSMVMSRKR